MLQYLQVSELSHSTGGKVFRESWKFIKIEALVGAIWTIVVYKIDKTDEDYSRYSIGRYHRSFSTIKKRQKSFAKLGTLIKPN